MTGLVAGLGSGLITAGAEQVRELVTMAAAVDAVRSAFAALAAGEFEMPTRTVLGDGRFLVMSVHHRPSATAVVKTLSLDFGGRDPAIAGTTTWSDLGRTDQVVMDAGAVTALRTGAVTGVATDLLAPPGASTCAVLGAGGQAADQVRGVHAVRPLTELRIVSRTPARAERLAATLAGELPGVVITTGSDADAAVEGRDIVCCATPSTVPLFTVDSLSPTVHVNAIGSFRPSMRELPEALLAGSHLVVDDIAAVLEESGEVIDALASGAISRDDLRELGTALGDPGAHRGRTVFKSVGVAVQDWAVARVVADRVTPAGPADGPRLTGPG